MGHKELTVRADWISLAELMELTGWDRSTITRKQSSGQIRTRLTERIRNGKARREYDASSLPAEFQAKRLQQAISSAPIVLVKSSDHPATARPETAKDEGISALATLSADEKAEAERRLSVIGPLIDFENRANSPMLPFGGAQAPTSLARMVKLIGATSPYSERTLWNWWKAYKTSGLSGLIGKGRSDKNISRFFAARKQAAAFASNKFWNERLSAIMVHEALLREWRRLRLSPSDAPPAYETTRVFLNSLPPLISTIARKGERAYNNDFAPYLLRDIAKVPVNQYWISDHMQHDIFVRNIDAETGKPVFNELGLNEAFRPWLTCIVDMRSRRVVGQVWCVSPSSNTINSALRIALRTFGLCRNFYIDNGKDYKKLGKRAPELSPDAQGVLIRLGIHSQHCLPKHPQSKQIESFFRTVHKQFDVLWRDAYCGSSPATRPEACDALMSRHKKLLAAGEGDRSPLPPASEFIQAALNWMDSFNSNFKCSGRGMNGHSPKYIYDSELPPSRRRPVRLADVAQLFWERQKRVVSEGGCIQLFNARYEPADSESAAALMLTIKREVLVACDPLSVGEAIALTMDGKFLGYLRAQELLVHGETSAEQIRASMRARRKIGTLTKQYLENLERNRRQAGDATELEIIQRRAVRNAVAQNIHTMPVLQAVNAPAQPRLHADDIADSFLEE
jgi:putative transposase